MLESSSVSSVASRVWDVVLRTVVWGHAAPGTNRASLGIMWTRFPQAFPDNAARREVESLPAVCPNQGCSWKGTLKDYEVGAPSVGADLLCLSFLAWRADSMEA